MTIYALHALTDSGETYLFGPIATPKELHSKAELLRRNDGTRRYVKSIFASTELQREEQLTKGERMLVNYIDADTLAVAHLVAEAEGISLAEAIRDQVELFSE